MSARPILIVGAGGIGGIVGAHLIDQGEEVVFADSNAAHVDAINRNGLRIVGVRPMHVRPAAYRPEETEGAFSRVVLAVKAKDTGRALDLVAARLAPDGWVLPLQNGLGMLDVAARVGAARVVGGVIAIGACYDSPGVVGFFGAGDTHVGEIDGRASARTERLAQMLARIHKTSATGNILGHAWGKLALGAAYAATALADADVLPLYRRADAQAVLTPLVREVARTAAANGVTIEPADGIDPAAFLDRDDAELWAGQIAAWRRYKNERTGIWRDLAIRKQPTEVPALFLPVVAAGERAGVATPRLRRLLESFGEVESGRRRLGLDTFFRLSQPARE